LLAPRMEIVQDIGASLMTVDVKLILIRKEDHILAVRNVKTGYLVV